MENVAKELRLWKAYATVTTLLIIVLVNSAFALEEQRTKFSAIDVQRINIVEPDGTLRMVISDKSQFPGIIINNKEHTHPNGRSSAGMIFYNDEGTENGGLIFGGMKDKTGTVSSYGHLSFDRYLQDQVFTIDASEEGKGKRSGLSIVDDPDWPITDFLSATPDEQKNFFKTHAPPRQRIYLGRTPDDSASLTLKDKDGHARIVIKVNPDGSPVIQFFDPSGKVISQLPNVPRFETPK
ncbi:MAG TPA: hypothetical protein VGS59_02510 [Candidatus Acidoferrales bacterium]|nr:hypothetical protein [Candidatus Acidoferrales bacterium]